MQPASPLPRRVDGRCCHTVLRIDPPWFSGFWIVVCAQIYTARLLRALSTNVRQEYYEVTEGASAVRESDGCTVRTLGEPLWFRFSYLVTAMSALRPCQPGPVLYLNCTQASKHILVTSTTAVE